MAQPQPDNKNWTWVLAQSCTECGYDSAAPARSELGGLIRANAASWRSLLGRGDLVSQRPPTQPGQGPIWSALEYGAHVRDVYKVMGERLKLLLTKSNPTFSDWDQDRTAVEERYSEQDPKQVAYDLARNAGRVADMVDRVRDNQWDRAGSRSDGDTFTVESLIRYLLHDVTHHVADVERGYEALSPDDDVAEGSDADDAGSGDQPTS